MNKLDLIKKICIGAWICLAMAHVNYVNAGEPVWTFTPLTPTKVTVPSIGTVNVQYRVTNQSPQLHTLLMDKIPGVTQVTTAGNCPKTIVLRHHQSCILNLSINGSELNHSIIGGPVLCEHGNPNECYQPSKKNILDLTLLGATLTTSVANLAASITGYTEFDLPGMPSSGVARVITITNIGHSPVDGLTVTPPTWPAGTTDSTTCGSTLAAGSSCTITIIPGNTASSDGTNPCTTGTAPVPGTVQVSSANANTVSTNVVILGYGCIYQGGYVFAFDDTTPTSESVGGKVAATTDQSTTAGIVWDASSGCTTFPFGNCYITNADSFTNGTNLATPPPGGNTYLIYQTLTVDNGELATSYAAGLCTGTIATFNDWYLPALCELGYNNEPAPAQCGTAGAPTLQNMLSNLVDNGDLAGLSTGGSTFQPGIYWSSTEFATVPMEDAFVQKFSSFRFQFASPKREHFGARCVRALTP